MWWEPQPENVLIAPSTLLDSDGEFLLRKRGPMKSNKKTRTDKSGVALQPTDPIHPVKLVCTFYIPLDGSRLSTV